MLKIDKKFTRRAVLYVGYLCNLKCTFCYYAKKEKKEWNSLDRCKNQAYIFRHLYNNRLVDITGGEPTIYPNIIQLVAYCRNIGLKPTIITNMQALAEINFVEKIKNAGIEDFLCSIHGLHEEHDKITGTVGSFLNVEKALENINFLEIDFRVNVVINNINYKKLKLTTEFVASKGCKIINYIFCNTFASQNQNLSDLQVRFSDLRPYLHEILDYCDSNNLKASIRYVPFCFMGKHKKKCYNFPQLPYDPYEWDCKSWLSNQSDAPDVIKVSSNLYNSMDDKSAYKFLTSILSKCDYKHPEPCQRCSLRNICDGLNIGYIKKFGVNEITPQTEPITDRPDFFLRQCC